MSAIRINALDPPVVGAEFDSAEWNGWFWDLYESLKAGESIILNGGGAAATLGTIGLTGEASPSTAAQAGWIRQFDNQGFPYWVPVWR